MQKCVPNAWLMLLKHLNSISFNFNPLLAPLSLFHFTSTEYEMSFWTKTENNAFSSKKINITTF